MKLVYALLLMSTTLGAGSAAFAAGQGLSHVPDASLASRSVPDAALILIDGDGGEEDGEEDDEGEGGWFWSLLEDGHADDDDCEDDVEDDEGEDDEDDECASGAAGNAAKAGTVAPPQNGLFTDGTAPVVKSN